MSCSHEIAAGLIFSSLYFAVMSYEIAAVLEFLSLYLAHWLNLPYFCILCSCIHKYSLREEYTQNFSCKSLNMIDVKIQGRKEKRVEWFLLQSDKEKICGYWVHRNNVKMNWLRSSTGTYFLFKVGRTWGLKKLLSHFKGPVINTWKGFKGVLFLLYTPTYWVKVLI